jgi:hypothetical protein
MTDNQQEVMMELQKAIKAAMDGEAVLFLE